LDLVRRRHLISAGRDDSYNATAAARVRFRQCGRHTKRFVCIVEAVASSLAAPERRRRTQAERRAATRAALLDASIDCLVEEGYANTTTRRIAERAGVTPGALHHHFADKAELLSAAVRHVGERFRQELLAQGPPDAASLQARAEQLLDHAWAVHRGPFFQASMELWVAARTDAELRATLVELQHEVPHLNAIAARILYPEMADQPGFAQVIETGLGVIRGFAILAFVDEADADAAWPAVRAHIIELSAEFIANAEASS
jgi:AcrR family transcriptional regulator